MFATQISAQDQQWNPISLDTDAVLHSVFFLDRFFGWTVGDEGTIFYTSDGGESWTRQNSRTTEHLNRVFFFDEYTGWIAADNNLILATQTGGERWAERRPSPVAGQHIKEVRFADWRRGWSAGGPGGQIYYTDNSGLIWQRQANLSPDATITSMNIRDHQTASIIYGNSIHHTTDGGSDWNESYRLSEQNNFSAVHHTILNDTTGIVIGNYQSDGIILRSSDGGNSWSETARFPGIKLRNIGFSDERTGYVTGTDGTLLKSENAGKTWTEQHIDTNSGLNSIHFSDPGCGWIAAENGMLYQNCDSEVPGIAYYKNRYQPVQISDESEALELLERSENYGNSALERDFPEQRTGYYGRMLAATELIEVFFDGDREEVSDHITRMRQHFWSHEYNAGAELFNRSLEPELEQNEVRRLLESSKIHIQHSVNLMPDSTQSLLSLASVYELLDDFPSAINAMEKAVDQMERPEIDQLMYLVDLYLIEGRLSDAIKTTELAAGIYPDEPSFYEVAADLLLEADETDEALTYLDSLIDMDPENPNYRYVRGNQLRELAITNLDAALHLYEEVWERRERLEVEDLSPDQQRNLEREADERLERVSALESAGTVYANRAASDLKTAVELNPDFEDVNGILGMFFFNRASFLYEMQTLTQDPDEAQRFVPNMNEYLGRARIYLERAVEINPETPFFWEVLYNTYLALGLTDEANRILDEGRF